MALEVASLSKTAVVKATVVVMVVVVVVVVVVVAVVVPCWWWYKTFQHRTENEIGKIISPVSHKW